MEKIISLFCRNYNTDHLVRDEVVKGAEWVIGGEGIPTKKLDGTCCLIRNGKLFKRHEIKKGKVAPSNFEPATEIDPVTGKQQGWVPVGDVPEDKWHKEAFGHDIFIDGTYELVGPAIQGNPEKYSVHTLIRHGSIYFGINDIPRDFNGLKEYLSKADVEGIVWHHSDGRMVKIKKRDFGFRR